MPKQKKITQQQLARAVGESQPAIARHIKLGHVKLNGDLLSCVVQLYQHAREVAAGRQPEDVSVDRVLEAALLDRAKREEIEIRIAEKREKLISDDVFVDALSTTFAALKTRLLGLPNRLRGKNPAWTQADIDNCNDEIREFLTELSDDRFPRHIRARLEAGRDRVQTRAAANGKSVGRRQPKIEL